MPLVDLKLSIEAAALPGDVREFLHEADRRIEEFRQQSPHLPGFVPSDYATTYGGLRTLAAQGVAPGDLFCEWGSGFGVAACLASMVGFDACGIEIEAELVAAARQLAEDFNLPVEFECGSFIPEGSETCLGRDEEFAWLTTQGGHALEESGFNPADFDTIFVYPWPDEESAMAALFERHAAVGAVLMTYHGAEDLRIRRKSSGRSRGRRHSGGKR